MQDWTPKQIVEELNRYIIGQDAAKRAVAVALRNRYRRSRLPKQMQDEITPKNIIMMGPTGVGKTEIARRLAKLVEAPFIKVEATKFTEVGYVGRDVDSMVRDLVEAAIRLVKNKKQKDVQTLADALAEQKLINMLVPIKKKEHRASQNPLEMLFGSQQAQPDEPMSDEEKQVYSGKKEEVAALLRARKLEDTILEMEIEEQPRLGMDLGGMGIELGISDALGGMLPKKRKKRKLTVRDARKLLIQEEVDKLIDMDEVTSEAISKAEQDGIIFLDEIDKIAGKGRGGGGGPDVSREGVQRDILPVVEGCTVSTKYGPVKTDYMLFIAAGAFHVAKISDLIPELQGRFPITVELKSLTRDDFLLILTQPENALTKQYEALLATDNIRLVFTEDALGAIADYTSLANENKENIGARRLHTVMECLLEDIAFNANGNHPEIEILIDANYVQEHLAKDIAGKSLQRFIL